MNEIILYQSDELPEHIEVRIKDETIWLNRQQMAVLSIMCFQREN